MEERYRKKQKKLHIPWKALLMGLVFLILAAAFAWNQGRTVAQAGFVMDKVDGKYVFNIVEVVPEKNQAILGFFIKGKENIPFKDVSDFALTNFNYKNVDYRNFFDWEEKGNVRTKNEPFSVVNGELVNNEIFKLYMLGIGDYDETISLYQNYVKHKKVLDDFDANYVIDYKVVTPQELNTMDLEKIHYIQFGSGPQIIGYNALYKEITKNTTAWADSFKDNNDINWDVAKKLYERAVSKDKRMSISMSGYSMTGDGTSNKNNIWKLYQMLKYFDDPSLFQELFKGGKFTKDNVYINPQNGFMNPGWGEAVQWDNFYVFNVAPHIINGLASHRGENYIPESHDNILLYYKGDGTGYFNTAFSRGFINIILNFTKVPIDPSEETEGTVKVLEIEPGNSYYLANSDNLSNLAESLQVEEEEISVTYATPNRLNGMTVDLVAEYDLIIIGDDISQFQPGSAYAQYPYRHIGAYQDSVIPQTLINGLLRSDYTTREEFNELIKGNPPGALLNTGTIPLSRGNSLYWNPGIRKQFNSSDQFFLKNVELSLELQKLGAAETVSRARFSGNDITAHMQAQLAEFVKSGQPVVLSGSVKEAANSRLEDFFNTDAKKGSDSTKPDPTKDAATIDGRLYLAVCGLGNGSEYHNTGINEFEKYSGYLNSISMYSISDIDNKKPIALHKEYKPEIDIYDVSADIEHKAAGKTIISKGKLDQKKPLLSSLERSNTLSFNYEITLPQGSAPKDCVMTIVLDQNGDGVYDIEGEGKTTDKEGKKGKQNNATETIKNDKVYTYEFSKAAEGNYTYESGLLSGTYTLPGFVESIEEILGFRVIVTDKNKNNSLRGVWTGYMRPDLEKKEITVLQILPYDGEDSGKRLADNIQFTDLVNSIEDADYQFNFQKRFDDISAGEFAAACQAAEEIKDEKALKKFVEDWLGNYDVIIAGTDFSCNSDSGWTDMDELQAGRVLECYAGVLKRPVIFTNDSISYENSENYAAPEKVTYRYRNLTLAEAEELKVKGELNEKNQNLRKHKITEREYRGLEVKNNRAAGWKGEGTAYLDPESGALFTEMVTSGTYKAVMAPITPEMKTDSRQAQAGIIAGYKGEGGNSDESRISIANTEDASIDVTAEELKWMIDQLQAGPGEQASVVTSDKAFSYQWYYTENGFMTEQELRSIYENESGSKRTVALPDNGVFVNPGAAFYYSDIYSALRTDAVIPPDLVRQPEKVITIAGEAYYEFYSNGFPYLAVKTEPGAGNGQEEQYGYVWQIKEEKAGESAAEYVLSLVAGKQIGSWNVLNPDKNSWNYLFTQSMRYLIGMDRFAVTTGLEKKEKRDTGSTRYWVDVTEIQGFTNETLLEYAYLPPMDSPASKQLSPYSNKALSLGSKPRTSYIEPLNEGGIGLYPFLIADMNDMGETNLSETRIPITKNHGPYYQLDLERELGEGKIDDVTVWYTFAGADGTGGTAEEKQESAYFDITRRDAGNNYYLYSKGKIYYTGFSLYEEKDSSSPSDDEEQVPDLEMKLFINTIYAALSGKPKESGFYEAVVKEDGTVSNISKAKQPGTNHEYTCYYDEDEKELEISFRVQKERAGEGERVPVLLGWKKGTEIEPLPEDAFILPEEILISAVPVEQTPPDGGENVGNSSRGVWYQIKIPLDQEESSLKAGALDGKTLMIAVAGSGNTLHQNAIHSEIHLVMRNLFDLD